MNCLSVEQKLIVKLLHTRVIHADETGINTMAKTAGYTACQSLWTLYYAHEKRGLEPWKVTLLTLFSGIWFTTIEPYFKLICQHALCMPITYGNWLLPMRRGQAWAKLMIDLLEGFWIRLFKGGMLLRIKPFSTANNTSDTEAGGVGMPATPEPEGKDRKKRGAPTSKSRIYWNACAFWARNVTLHDRRGGSLYQ